MKTVGATYCSDHEKASIDYSLLSSEYTSKYHPTTFTKENESYHFPAVIHSGATADETSDLLPEVATRSTPVEQAWSNEWSPSATKPTPAKLEDPSWGSDRVSVSHSTADETDPWRNAT